MAVLVPDATRATFVSPMVEGVVELLLEAKLHAGDVHLLIAGGLHRPPRSVELTQLLGQAEGHFPVHVHDADDTRLVGIGTTRCGTPVELSPLLLRSHTLIVISGITPHYFAGWTGGIKGIVPGAAGRATITANHRLAVDPTRPDGLHPACREGALRGNPVAADLAEAAARVPASPFLVNVVIGRDGDPRGLVTGSVPAAHRAGLRLARRLIRLRVKRNPLVLVAAGEPGRERDWIQAHKLVRQGATAVADGGTLIALAACPDGVGSATLLDWFGVDPSRLAAEVAGRYTLHGHTALAIRALLRRIRVILVSRLDPGIVRLMGMTPAASLAEALDLAAQALPRGTPGLVLPRAGALLIQ